MFGLKAWLVRNRFYCGLGLFALIAATLVFSQIDGQPTAEPTTPVEDVATPTAGPTIAPSEVDQSVMEDALARFAAAYYSVGPDDTTASHQATVTATDVSLSEDALSSMDFTVYVNDDINRSRINQRLGLTASLDPDDITIANTQDDGRRLYATAPVTITTTYPDGRVYGETTVMLGTVWQATPDDGWTMTAFGENR